jgi:hypothetical protein
MAGYLGLNKSLSKHKLVDSIQQKWKTKISLNPLSKIMMVTVS